MATLWNVFKFIEVVRTSNSAILLKFEIAGNMATFTAGEIQGRIRELRQMNATDSDLAHELRSISEYKRELQRDQWPEIIDYFDLV